MEHIKYRIDYYTHLKEEFGINNIICNNIQTSISLWKEDLETVTEKNEKSCSCEKKLLLLVELLWAQNNDLNEPL